MMKKLNFKNGEARGIKSNGATHRNSKRSKNKKKPSKIRAVFQKLLEFK